MLKISEIVKHLIIVNVLVYFAFTTPVARFLPGLEAYFPLYESFSPYQIITHMFMHSKWGLSHLLFNMFALFVFGPAVEYYVTSKRFLILYFASGLGSLSLHYIMQYVELMNTGYMPASAVVGASGAIMGIAVAFAVLFPNKELYLLFVPIPIKAKYLIGAYVLFDLFSGITGSSAGVANWGHLGGAITGYILTQRWIRRRPS